MEEAPGDGSDVVEETNGFLGCGSGDGTGSDQESQMRIDLFGRSVRDACCLECVVVGLEAG